MGEFFDVVLKDDYFGEKAEKAECRMFQEAAMLAITKAGSRYRI